MENNKKLSLDDIFGKPSTTQQPQSKMDLETIFGKEVEPASVAPEGSTIDSMRNMSIAPISFPKVEMEQQGVIGEDVLQADRSAFEKEIAADQEAIFPPKQDYAPLNPASIKIGRAMPEVGSVDKPKNLQQTVRSEISKEWGGDLRKFVEDTHKAPAENIQMANDMEAHFWNVMTDKLPKDGFISQEDMDPYSFVRKYDNGDEVTEYSLGHYTYPQEVVNEYIARHNDEVLHEMRFKDDAAYRNDWFLRNVGVTEQVYRDEIADDLENRLQELRKKIVATLPAQHARGGYAAIGAAANKPSSGAPVSIEKIDKALKVVSTLRKNNFGAGLKEGFDLADILTLGVSGIGENVALLNALNKSTSGKTLTNAEQALVEAWDIQNEAEEVINTLGGRTLGANIGRGSAMSLGFVTQTLGTSGIASLATKGISRAAARTALRRAANTGLSNQIKEGLRYGGLKVVESAVGAAARTPFMGFTYRNYTDKRLDQFQVKERLNLATGEVGKYIDKQDASALRDAVHTALESFFESQSEDVGGLIDFGITSFARALPLNKMIRSAAINGLTGPVQSGAMRWLRESAKIYGLAGETLSEAYGDAMVNLLTSNSDGWKQMATSEYWWELIGVSSMLSGGFGVVNRGVNWVNNREISRDISKSEQLLRKSLSRIEDDNLKKELTEATLTDDVIYRSKRLSSLDWSNFSREDMANAVDFIDAQTRLDVMREGATESRRLARIMPAIDEVKKLVDGGALDDEQAAASLATIYSDLFRTQENQRALNILTDRIKVAADAGISADKINDILRGAGLTVFNPGDEIETLTGDRAIVDKVLPGAYEIVNDEGVREVVSFEEVLQNAPEIRQIQQESQQPVTQSESAPEINPQVEQAVESARQEAEAIKNLDDDVIYEATLSDGTPVNIIKGANIVYNNQTGEVDYDASDATVVVRLNDGSKRQISIRDIDSIDQAMSVDEALQVATEAAIEVVNSQEQSETPTAEVSSAQAEIPIVQEAEATTAEQASESPATQPEQQAQIPTLKNGDPDYNAMDAQMFTEQYVSRFGEDMTERVARNNIKASNKTISNIEKQIEDVTDPNKMPALYSKLQDAQATKDKYVAVLEELGLSSDESEDNAARVQRKKQENTSWFNKLFPDGFPNVESVILWDISNGNRIRWANKEVNGAVVSKGLGSELGLADSNAERTRRIALIGKDAPTPEEYAEQLPERLKAMGVRFEEGELRDKVLDVYASVDTVRKAKEELEKMSANIQAEQEGLDYEEEQMRRNYEREQEALRQEAQPEVGTEQTEQEQLTNEEAQEEGLSIEDEVPFMVSSDSVQATTEAQKLATEAAIIALEDAGVEVVNATPEMVEEAGRTMHSVDVTDSMRESVMQGQPMFYRRPNGTVYGWTNGTTVYLTESGMNPNTPIHEYTHIWSDAMRKHNPEGWASIVKLLKGTPVWNEVMADTNYVNIHGNENKVASEALSRISGRENSAKMEAMAQLMIDENANDTVKKNRARKLLDRMRKALQEFWSWVGKELFGIKNFESIDQVTDRILYDLVSGTDLAATPSLASQVKAVIDEYDNADEVFTINDVAARISEVVNNYTGTESTTELENILEDFEEAQNSAGRYGYRMDSGGEDAFEEALRAYAAKAPIEGFSIQPQERAEIIRLSKANGTYLKAPNGKDTNLTSEQWVTVRTKAFKRWFGDWENGGASSQILDANGEPLVVWHGGEFAKDEFVANGSMHFGTKVAALQRILDNAWGYGNWTVGRNAEGRWSWKYTDPDDTGHDKQGETAFALPIDALVDAARIASPKAVVRPYYLNIRNLERTEDQNSDWVDAVSFSMDAGYDGIIYHNEFEDEGEDSYVAFYPNQIKLAEGNTTFDPDNDDVRFSIERDNESEDDLSIVEHKMTPLARLEAERDMLLENRENNPNFEQEYAAIEERIREERETDRVALTIVDGFESEAHRVAVEDALFDYVRENELFASQMYVVNNYEAFIEKIKELFTGADVSSLDPNVRAIYRDGMIVICADEIDTRVTGIAKLMHEYTHALTVENLSNNSFYRRMLQIAKGVGAPYMVARLEGYEDLGIDKSDSGLVDGLMELLARDMEFVVRNGRLDEFLASEDASEVVLREYFEKYDVPQPLTELLIEIATEIRSIKYGKINLNQKGYRATQSSLLRTSRGNDGANLSSDARDYERGGVFRRSRTHESTEGSSADSRGEVGEGSRGYRADLANSQEQTTRSDKNKQLIAELRAKLRDSKAEVKTVAAEVSKLVRKSITPELVEKLGKRTFDGIVKIIEDATVRRDLEYAVNRIEEVVLDLEIKDNQDKFNKFLDLRIQGESARGVSVAANVTDQTRQYITIIRDNLDRPASEVAALIEERGGTLAERTGLQVLEFYQDAKEHAHEVDDIEHDIAEIKVKNTKLRKDRAALNKAGKTVEARKLSEEIEQNKQLIENLNSERIMTKRSQLYYLGMAAGELEKEIAYGKEGHKEWLQTEVERKQQLINIAWNDIRDGKKIPILDQERSIWQKVADAIKDFLLAPAYSWDYLLKMISVNAPGGEGALYDHFMRSEYGYVESAAKYWTSYNDFKDQLNKKAQEIFGKDYKQVLKDSNQALDVQIQLAAQYAKTHAATDENTKIREGASEVYTPTIGEVLYAYMAYKMADGKVKLDKMGLTEDKIDMLVRMIPQQYIDFAEWIQDEFLPERRKAYNKTHLEVFGTQMAQVENYVPLRVKKDFVYEEFDGSKVDTPQLPSSITGSIIKRKRNSLPIDLHTNVFDLMLDHGQQMEHWNAYTRIVRDTNQFLSNTQIRRALNFRNPSLHKKLKEAALIASNSYQPDVDKMEKMTVALSKMAASSKIAFRFNTAIKQVLSYPAFYAYAADAHFWGYLTRNLSPDTWGRNFRWALDNIPSFQERWLGRMAGDDRLAQMTAPQLDQWIKRMGSVGMFANALVDAMTCANGAQAVYRYEYERYKKAGLDDTEADRMAKIAAAQAINQTQQSSEGMYLSRIQADRTFFAVALSTFQNSNFAYLRKELEGIDQLFRKTEKQIANRTRYYEGKGLSTDQAAKLAAEEVVRANKTAVAKILMFTFILNTIWTLGNSVWKFAFGDEDEEDTWQQATIRGFLNSWTRNLSIGQYVETLAWSDFRELNPSLLLSDLNTFMDRIEKIAEGKVKVWDRTAAWTTLSTISSMGVGVDINSFASMYEGVAGAIDNGINVEDMMLFVNAPRSQAKFIAGPPKEGESLDDYTKRQAWIERKIMSRVDKKQLDKWSRNYEAYKQAEMLGTPYLRDKTGAVKVPYIQEIEASYTDMLRRIGRTKAGDKRPDSEKLSDRTTQKVKELDMVRRIKAINDLEKQFEAMVVMNEVYEARLKELCRAKQDLVNTWNK